MSGHEYAGLQRLGNGSHGKTGDDLLIISQRQDQQLSKKGLPGDFLTRHGNFAGPRENFFATINQLTYGPKQHGDPRVDTFIWTGQNHHDAGWVACTIGLSDAGWWPELKALVMQGRWP
eukprot:scaffold159062_cov15-Tisochrysis_lutea.AAC.1